MLKFSFLASALLLTACAAPAPEHAQAPAAEPLASEAVLIAAEQAPLSGDALEWNAPFEPFNIIGNIQYVGMGGVSAYLITTPDGHFLIDGGVPQSAPQIIAHIEALGFDIADVRYLLNSHAHWDHAGGLARLQRASGATMVASEGDRSTLEAGQVAYGPSSDVAFPPVRGDHTLNIPASRRPENADANVLFRHVPAHRRLSNLERSASAVRELSVLPVDVKPAPHHALGFQG